jgi:DNA-binding transcriptional LysR family regulator
MALAAVDDAVAAIRRACGTLTGRLVVGCAYDAQPIAIELLTPFRALHPDLDVALWISRDTEILRELESGGTDAGVLWGRPSEHPRALELAREPVVVALPRTHPLARMRTVDRTALRQETVLLDRKACSPAWHELALELGATVRAVELVEPSDEALLALAAETGTLALVTRRAFARHRRRGQVLRALHPPLTIPAVLTWRSADKDALQDLVNHTSGSQRQ